MRRLWILLAGGLLWALPASAQTVRPLVDGVASGLITASGSTCAVDTACFAVNVKDVRSWTTTVTKGTSITAVWEIQSVSGGTWYAYPGGDDAGSAASTTTDGIYLFTNAGYYAFRVRASALSGTASVVVRSGGQGSKSTATVSGGGDASAAKQDTGNSSLASIDTNTGLAAGSLGDIYGVVSGVGTLAAVTGTVSTNATSAKATPGTLYGVHIVNTNATIYYLRLYNLAAAPTCSSATGYLATVPIPASTSGAGISMNIGVGATFSAGIAYCLTGGPTSTDNTNAAAGLYGFLIYK